MLQLRLYLQLDFCIGLYIELGLRLGSGSVLGIVLGLSLLLGLLCVIFTERRLREMVLAGSLVMFRVSAGATIRVRDMFRVLVRGLELGLCRCLRLRLWVGLDEGEGLV